MSLHISKIASICFDRTVKAFVYFREIRENMDVAGRLAGKCYIFELKAQPIRQHWILSIFKIEIGVITSQQKLVYTSVL